MARRATAILALAAILVFSCLPGQAAAADYTRQVFPLEDGSTLYVFSLSDKLEQTQTWLWRFLLGYGGGGASPICGSNPIIRPLPKPTPKPEPTPQPIPDPDPTPIPDPTPVPDPTPPTPDPIPDPEPDPVPDPGNAQLTEKERQLVDLVNQERTRLGLAALSVDMDVVKLARMKAQDMVDNGYFSHQSPTFGSPFDMMREFGVSYRAAGENIAGAPTVERAHTALMNSDGHRRNILSTSFDSAGIGIIEGGPYGLMVCQMFIGK